MCERERDGVTSQHISYLNRNVCVCVCVCVRVRVCVCANTYELHHCVYHATLFPSRAFELMVKLRTLLIVFAFILKAEARDYGKGRYISDVACGVWPITMHWVS